MVLKRLPGSWLPPTARTRSFLNRALASLASGMPSTLVFWPVVPTHFDDCSTSNRTAYIHGLNFCTGDFVIIMDADLSHHVRLDVITTPSPFSLTLHSTQAQIHTPIYPVGSSSPGHILLFSFVSG